jgi:hypothetical protein
MIDVVGVIKTLRSKAGSVISALATHTNLVIPTALIAVTGALVPTVHDAGVQSVLSKCTALLQ